MAIYHLHIKNISRGDGRSAVAAAAYRAGETLPNDAEEKDSNFGGRRDVLHAEILMPDGAPTRFTDRATLWNAVEAAEGRKDSRLAKEVEFALPRELAPEARLALARTFAATFVAQGFIVDLAIHGDGRDSNPHAHMMLTTRQVGPQGFGAKLRMADGIAFLREARRVWEIMANEALAKAGVADTIDARSHAARGIARAATRHRGPDAAERAAKRAGMADRGLNMREDTLEARRELLRDEQALERFPLLRARPDWPPTDPEPHGGLNVDERAEFKAFWQEVTSREVGLRDEPEQKPSVVKELAGVAIDLARADFDRLQNKVLEWLARPTEGTVAREADRELVDFSTRMAEIRRTLAEAAGERAAMQRELDAFRAKYPVMSWGEYDQTRAENASVNMRAELQRLSARSSETERAMLTDPQAAAQGLAILRDIAAERERLCYDIGTLEARTGRERGEDDRFPVPGPDGRPIAPEELERAEEALLDEMHRPAREIPAARPSPAPVVTRDASLDWLNDTPERSSRPPPEREARAQERELPQRGAVTRDPELAWLNDVGPARQGPDDDPEYERDPERERY